MRKPDRYVRCRIPFWQLGRDGFAAGGAGARLDWRVPRRRGSGAADRHRRPRRGLLRPAGGARAARPGPVSRLSDALHAGLVTLHALLFWALGGPYVLAPRALALVARAALALCAVRADQATRAPSAVGSRAEPVPAARAGRCARALGAAPRVAEHAVRRAGGLVSGEGQAGQGSHRLDQAARLARSACAGSSARAWPPGSPICSSRTRALSCWRRSSCGVRLAGPSASRESWCRWPPSRASRWSGWCRCSSSCRARSRCSAHFVGAVNQAGLGSPAEPSIGIPLLCLVGGLWLVRRRRRRSAVALVPARGCALFGTQYPRMDTLHLAWSAPLLLVVGAVALDRVRPVAASPWLWCSARSC